MVKLPYDTSYGKKIYNNGIRVSLFKYLSLVDVDSLQYEYVSDSKTKLVYILGKNEDEKRLPVFDQPCLVDDLRGGNVVAIDLRAYVRAIKDGDDIVHIADVAKDSAQINFLVLYGLLSIEYYDGNLAVTSNVAKNIMASYAMFVGGVVANTLSLSMVEQVNTYCYAALYANLLLSDSDDIEEMANLTAVRAASMKLGTVLAKDAILSMFNTSDMRELYKKHGKSLDLLVELIRQGVAPEKAGLVNLVAIFNTISTMWYGPGGSKTMVLSLEYMPAWISLVVMSTADITYKRSRLTTLLSKYDKTIRIAELDKYFLKYLNEHDVSTRYNDK